ncbi:MAG: endoribonuclease MazF [Gemmatimonadota bacterium]|nr:endoribonuclease MazF [Gemmatimonadota bacterium]
MVEIPYVPDRGDLVWIDFDPQAGHEQAGRRPGLVVSPALYNGRRGLAVFCPITSRHKGYPFEVHIPEGPAIQGVVLSDQLKSLDWRARRTEHAGILPKDALNEVLARILTLVGR